MPGWFSKKKQSEDNRQEAGPEASALANTKLTARCVVVLRQGMSKPSDEEVKAYVQTHAPEYTSVPAHGLAQPVWWQRPDWLDSGMRSVAMAYQEQYSIDPSETEWRIVETDAQTKLALVFLYG